MKNHKVIANNKLSFVVMNILFLVIVIGILPSPFGLGFFQSEKHLHTIFVAGLIFATLGFVARIFNKEKSLSSFFLVFGLGVLCITSPTLFFSGWNFPFDSLTIGVLSGLLLIITGLISLFRANNRWLAAFEITIGILVVLFDSLVLVLSIR